MEDFLDIIEFLNRDMLLILKISPLCDKSRWSIWSSKSVHFVYMMTKCLKSPVIHHGMVMKKISQF